MSRSSLYQRRDIPRYRRPGSRVFLFDQDELEAWLKTGRIGGIEETTIERTETPELHQTGEGRVGVVDFSTPRVYHRSARYR